jgi:hypothetical protein
VNRENLEGLARLLESGAVKVVIDKVDPLPRPRARSPICSDTTPEARSSSP